MCPADILIIDTKDDFCQIDSKFVNGMNAFEKKYPVKSTSCKL